MSRLPIPIAMALVLAAPGVAAAQSPNPGARSVFPASLSGPVLAAWLGASTTIRPESIIAVGGGRVVAAAGPPTPLPAPGAVRLVIRTELVSLEAAHQLGALSESTTLDVDCPARRARVGETLQYSQRNLMGSMQVKPGWTDWAPAAPGTTLDKMISAACVQTPPRPAPTPPPAPRPAIVAAPKPFASLVQISAAPSQSQAEAALKAAETRYPDVLAGRPTSVESISVGGQTFYRALFGGFKDAAQAAALCKALQAAGGACLVRQR